MIPKVTPTMTNRLFISRSVTTQLKSDGKRLGEELEEGFKEKLQVYGMTAPTILVTLLAGLGSFVASCILPMISAFLAYISGTTVSELGSKNGTVLSINRINIVLNTIFFVLGFSVVFSILGVLINSVLSNAASEFTESLNMVGGIIIVSFGIFFAIVYKNSCIKYRKKNFCLKIQNQVIQYHLYLV